jgi:thioredoxin 1
MENSHKTLRRTDPGARIETLSEGTFGPHVLEGKGPVVVEFMSYSCAYCGALEPVLQDVARTLDSTLFFRVNIAMEQELASAYRIQGTPTLVMFLNGEEVGRIEGPQPTVPGILAAVTQPFEP